MEAAREIKLKTRYHCSKELIPTQPGPWELREEMGMIRCRKSGVGNGAVEVKISVGFNQEAV